MKQITLTLVGSILAAFSYAQTTLPTSYDFATAPAVVPSGWATNTTSSYSSGLNDNNGSTSKAGKLQVTGHFYQIDFFDEPGVLEYNLKSYGTNSFVGTLLVEESVDGNVWTTLHTFGNNDFDNTWNQFTDNPNSASRHIRFNLSNKVSGTNAGLDNVSLAEVIPVNAEINAQYNGNNVPTGTGISFNSAVSVAEILEIVIENKGSGQILTLGTPSISGAAAADYSVLSSPTSIATQSEDTLKLQFTPAANGSRNAEISVPNNDSNEDPYIILLNGVGGNLATEPSASPTNFSTTILKTYRIRASFDASLADGHLVLFSRLNDFSSQPVDGSVYGPGDAIGSAKVAAVGTMTNFEIRDAIANTEYFIRVYAFNGEGSFTNYRTSDPIFKRFETPLASMRVANYYDGVDEQNASFVTDLRNTIFPHNTRFYSNYGPDMVPPFLERDTANGENVVTCVYSGFEVTYPPAFDWSATDMNREHTFPYSWMPTNGDQTTQEYQDYHHLFPTLATANFQRLNYPLGEVVNASNVYGDGKVGQDANGNTVYEPRDAQKGDAVRAMMYMQAAYHDPNGDSWALNDLGSLASDQKTSVYLDWHLQDLPSNFERARNDFLDSLQQNRNPFIDSTHWVCYINFRTMEYNATPDSTCLAITMPSQSIDTTNNNDTADTAMSVINLYPESSWNFYPNPTNEVIIISKQGQYTIYDITGKTVLSAGQTARIDLAELKAGVYMIRDERGHSERFIKR
jgi:hypothetical protein